MQHISISLFLEHRRGRHGGVPQSIQLMMLVGSGPQSPLLSRYERSPTQHFLFSRIRAWINIYDSTEGHIVFHARPRAGQRQSTEPVSETSLFDLRLSHSNRCLVRINCYDYIRYLHVIFFHKGASRHGLNMSRNRSSIGTLCCNIIVICI